MVDLDIAAARPQAPLPAPFHTWALPDGAPWTDFHREHGGYLLRYQVTISVQTAATDTAAAASNDLELDFQLTSVNQPVTVQVPAACPPPGTATEDTIGG